MRKTIFITFYLSGLFIFASSITNAQTVDELIAEGDGYYSQFDNQKALETYKKAEEISPDNFEILWRISRAYVDIGEHMPTETSEQEDEQFATYELALEYAEKAVELDSTQSINYIRRATANGRIALFKGVFSVAGVVNSVRDDCETAIELGNGGNYFQAVAHYVLGRTHDKISDKWAPARGILGLGWADIDTAIVEYKKAIDLYPNFVMFYLDFAKAYIEEDEYDLAREMLNNAINSPIKDEDDEEKIEEAKALLKEIEDE